MDAFFLRCSLFMFGLFTLAPMLVGAQHADKLPPVSRTYALTRATIIPSPGKKIDNGTVVIKNGIIKAVGQSVAIPVDAVVLPMDSMYLYPAFIDGLSYAGVRPEEITEEKVEFPGDPDPKLAGITPHYKARDFLNPADRSIEKLRNQGFAVAQVVPHGGMLPGKVAVVLLGGETVDDMVLADDVALCAEIAGAAGVYPSTVMGVMAKWRDLYRQASLAKAYESDYRANPVGRERPHYNDVLMSFYPVIDNRQLVLFKANKLLDIQRALSLSDELDFRLIITGLKEGWPIADKIKAANVGVFLSLDFPKKLKKLNAEDSSTMDAEKKALRKRAEQAVANATGQAVLFSEKKIPFGFTTDGVKTKDIRPNLRSIMEAGLSEDDMLAALTTIPAQMLGMSDRLGTIAVGKIANLLVSDKPYFEEKALVKHVFVDGEKYDVEGTKKRKSGDGAPVDVAGSWPYTVDTPQGKVTGVLVLTKKGDEDYSGTITNSYTGEETNVEDLTAEGNSISFTFTIRADDGQSTQITVDVSVEEDTFEGMLSVGEDSFPIEGTKKPELTE